MKRRFVITACFFALFNVAFADELTNIYKQLFDASPSMIQKAEIMQSMADSGSAADAPYYGELLQRMNSTDTSLFKLAEREAYDKIVRLLCQKLGEYARKESADDLIKIGAGADTALLRAEALIALGKVGGVQHVEIVARMLADLNIKSIPDRVYGEQLAYGLILCLSKFNDIRGWKPVFNASKGWYSNRIRLLASNALPSMVDDPTEAVKDIINLEDIESKRLALGYELGSKASAANKIAMCVLGLQKGVETRSADPSQRNQPLLLRKLAIENLVKLGDGGQEAVDLCRQAYVPAGIDEKLLIMALYGANKSDAAALALGDIITDSNTRRMSEVSDSTSELITKAAIQNAGKTKNQKALPSLIGISANSKWSPGILQEAKLAQDAIKAK